MSSVTEGEDVEVMTNGDYLISKLNETGEPWLIIHGHKHFPEIFYNKSNSTPSVLTLSSGSVSAQIYERIKDDTSNQYYILDIDLDATEVNGVVTGEFYTMSYNIATGWSESTSKNLPCYGGFGNIDSVRKLENSFSELLGDRKIVSGKAVDQFQNIVRYVTPETKRKLIAALERKGITVYMKSEKIVEVGRG